MLNNRTFCHMHVQILKNLSLEEQWFLYTQLGQMFKDRQMQWTWMTFASLDEVMFLYCVHNTFIIPTVSSFVDVCLPMYIISNFQSVRFCFFILENSSFVYSQVFGNLFLLNIALPKKKKESLNMHFIVSWASSMQRLCSYEFLFEDVWQLTKSQDYILSLTLSTCFSEGYANQQLEVVIYRLKSGTFKSFL